MKHLKVFLKKGVPAPVYFHVTATPHPGFITLLRRRDWQVFHLKGHSHPLVRGWGSEEESLFVIQLETACTDHREAAEMVEKIHHMDWRADHDGVSVVRIPLIAHDHFVIVPKDDPDIVIPDGPLCVVQKPWLLWVEKHDESEPLAVIALLPA